MVNKAIVLETIKKMRASGIEDAVILDTLKGIGLDRHDAEDYLASVSENPAPAGTLAGAPSKAAPKLEFRPGLKPTPENAPAGASEKIADRTASAVKKHLDEHREETELRETKTHAALIEHAEKLTEVEGGVSKLNEKISSFSSASPPDLSAKLNSIDRKISELGRKISDVKAEVSATKSIMEKVLEANRKIISKMK